MTSIPGNSVPQRFERVTVYVDFGISPSTSEEGRVDGKKGEEVLLLKQIQACAAALTSQLVVVDVRHLVSSSKLAKKKNTEGVETVTVPEGSSWGPSTTIELLRYWQAEEADVYTRYVNNTVPFMQDWECLITSKDTRDGAVTYALHRRQMPVLSLARKQSTTPMATPRSGVEELLYTCVSSDETLEGKKEAITRFFTFPMEWGVYVAGPSVTAAGEAKSPDSCEAGAVESSATHSVVVVVNKDGYPVRLPQTSSLLPPPPTRFAGILRTLCSADSTQMGTLRQRNPLLPGLLAAFHRYENRGLLRAAVRRGYRVEVMNSVEDEQGAFSAEDMVCSFLKLSLNSGDEAGRKERERHALSTLRAFESEWLELPLPQAQSSVADGCSP